MKDIYKNLNQELHMKRIFFMCLVTVSCIVGIAIKAAHAETDDIIKEGLANCYQLQSDQCVGVMHTLNNICADSYFESCFGDKWAPFMQHLSAEYEDQGLDPYVTVNNEHYGNDQNNN